MAKKKQQKTESFITWLSGGIIMLCYSFFSVGLLCFVLFSGTARNPPELWAFIVLVIMLGILPLCLCVWMITLGWKVVEISEEGVKSSLFKIFFKRKLSWDEIKEFSIKRIPTGGAWIFFSKKSLNGMSIGKARRQKGQIQVMASQKLYDFLKENYSEIIDRIEQASKEES